MSCLPGSGDTAISEHPSGQMSQVTILKIRIKILKACILAEELNDFNRRLYDNLNL